MKIRHLALFSMLMLVSMHLSTAGAQTRKPLTNQDVIDMTKQALAPAIIVKAVEANQTDFDVSAQALLDLKSAGVDASVMEAMLSSRATSHQVRLRRFTARLRSLTTAQIPTH